MKQKKSIPSPKGQIEIKTQRTSYYSNETIVGWVFLNVKEPEYMAGIVRLRFVGKARSTHTFDDLEYGQLSQLNKKFLNSSIHLHDFGKLLPIVQIVFPFEISLNLFASTLQIGSNQEETIVEFYIVSEVVNQKNKLDTQIKFRLPIKILRGFKKIPIPMNNYFRGDQYYCCFCCFRKDIYSIIKMNFLKNEYKKLDSITINVEIDQSNCSQDMYMSIKLIKKLVIKFLPITYEKTIEIQKIDYLKCEGLQKRDHTVVFNLNYEQLESTQISTDIQLQYFLCVYIIPFRMNYQFPITINGTENLQMDKQMFNYNQQDSFVGKGDLFDKMASLDVNQSNFLKQEQILQLSMYNNLQIDGNELYSCYSALKTNIKPVTEDPVMKQQTKTLQE